MSRLHFTTGFLLLVATAQVSAQTLSDGALKQIDTFLSDSVDATTVPGVVAIVVTPDKVLYRRAFGHQNVKKHLAMQEDSVFRIASMTKPITSVAVMQLVEEGKVSLDDPISRHLAQLSQSTVLGQTGTGPSQKPITIRHLLNHTSGYGYWFSHQDLAELQRTTGKNDEELPLVHEPGQRWTYGCSTRVLGQLVEHVSGSGLDEYLQDRIIKPLRMADTGYRVPAGTRARLVTVHLRDGRRLREEQNKDHEDGEIVGDYGLRSTAMDYGRFLQVFLNDGQHGSVRILRPDSIKEMTSNQIGRLFVQEQPGAIPRLSRNFPIGAGRDKFGLGFQITMQTDRFSRSIGSFSWAGIYNTHFWVDPRRKIAAVLLMQVLPFYDENCIELLLGFEERLYQNLE